MNHETAFRRTFRESHAVARRLLRAATLPRDRDLRHLLDYGLESQTASEYPFVFRAAFARRAEDERRVRGLGGAIHLLQSAAFVTDDVFDGSALRYGAPAIHVKYDLNRAVLAAELYQFTALEGISAELATGRFDNGAETMSLFHRIARELYLGQYLDVVHSGNTELSRNEYYRIIRLGVGDYFSNLARAGALLAGKPAGEVEALARFGYHYGMALFITDDVVDVLQTPEQTGKSFGCDLRNRRMRLPVLVALERADAPDRAALRGFLRSSRVTERGIREAARRVTDSGALTECMTIARRHVRNARRKLSSLREGHTRGRLDWLAATLIDAQQLDL